MNQRCLVCLCLIPKLGQKKHCDECRIKMTRERNKRSWKRRNENGKNAAYRRVKLSRPAHRLAHRHRNRVWELCKGGSMKKSSSSAKLLGCSSHFLKQHIESQFKKGMKWSNYGISWVVDHIIPLASFNLSNQDQQRIAFNWQNLRPMEKSGNAVKGDNITEPQSFLPLCLPH